MNTADGTRPFPGRYPWALHLALLAPLAVLTLLIMATQGCWGDAPRLHFALLRDAHPGITAALRLLTNWGNPLLYTLYVCILMRALLRRDRNDLVFCLRFTLVSILFLCVFMQLLKYGLGLPRPGIPGPAQPFGGKHYTSFPSGHTADVIISAIPLAVWCRSHLVSAALALVVAGMGVSRMWLGLHHPIDIIASLVFASLGVLVILRPGAQRRLLPGLCAVIMRSFCSRG